MRNDDKIFKVIAKDYIDKEAEELRELLEKLNKEAKDTSLLDIKVKKSLKNEKKKIYYIASSLVSCFVLLFITIGVLNYTSKLTSPDEISNIHMDREYDIEKLSKMLPLGFTVSDIDYDIDKTIYYVIGNNNKIILETQKTDEEVHSIGLKEIYLSYKKVYGIEKGDYSLLTFKLSDVLYTLTSAYDADDLITIGEKIISSQ